MPLFTVSLLFSLEVEASHASEPLREWAMHVLFATDEADARTRGEALGKAHETSYKNREGEAVRNIFMAVVQVQQLLDVSLFDGLEVASWMFRRGERLVLDERGVRIEHR